MARWRYLSIEAMVSRLGRIPASMPAWIASICQPVMERSFLREIDGV
jgi:hypothetical protein